MSGLESLAVPVRCTVNGVEHLKTVNEKILSNQPWTVGLVEAIAAIDVIGRQRFDTKNRIALLLLDSNLEISLKQPGGAASSEGLVIVPLPLGERWGEGRFAVSDVFQPRVELQSRRFPSLKEHRHLRHARR